MAPSPTNSLGGLFPYPTACRTEVSEAKLDPEAAPDASGDEINRRGLSIH